MEAKARTIKKLMRSTVIVVSHDVKFESIQRLIKLGFQVVVSQRGESHAGL